MDGIASRGLRMVMTILPMSRLAKGRHTHSCCPTNEKQPVELALWAIYVPRAGIGILKRGKPKSIILSYKSIVYKYID